MLSAITLAFSQDKPKPETFRLEQQSQQEIADAQRVVNEARAALDAASARYDAAQQKVVAAVFKAMADAGLKPKEWVIKQDQLGVYFERIKPGETASVTAPAKAEPVVKPLDAAPSKP